MHVSISSKRRTVCRCKDRIRRLKANIEYNSRQLKSFDKLIDDDNPFRKHWPGKCIELSAEIKEMERELKKLNG